MKVLGKGDRTIICEITASELDRIYASEDYVYEVYDDINVGDDLSLAKVVGAAKWLKQVDQELLNRAHAELETALSGIVKVKDTVAALTLFDKLGQDYDQGVG